MNPAPAPSPPARPLRFALLCAPGPVPRWQADCVTTLAEAGVATCVAVLLRPTPDCKPAAAGPGARAYAAMVRRGTRALDAVDPAPGIRRLPLGDGTAAGPAEAAAGPAEPAAGPLDFILCFDAQPVPAGPEPRWGVWRFRLGGRALDGAGLPAQAETAVRTLSVLIELVAECGGAARVMHRARLPRRRTHVRTLDALAGAAPALCVGACRRVAIGAVPGDCAPAAALVPPRGAAAALLGQALTLGERFWRLLQRDEWRVGVVETSVEEVLAAGRLPEPRWLARPPLGRFHADPFPVVAGGRTFLLFEMYDEAERRGWIAATPLDEPEAITQAPVAIDLGCHMSYPSVFVFEGATYCAPEAATEGGLLLFRMGATPWSWTQVAHLMPGLRLADPTLFEHAGRWWMFATLDGPAVGTELHLWHAPSPFGPWTAHPLNPVKSDVCSARPAGAVMRVGDGLVRPGQDCGGGYGRAVVLHRILRLDTEGYEEAEAARIEAGPGWQARSGLHTMNAVDGVLVIDAKRRVPVVVAVLRILLARLREARPRWSVAAVGAISG